MSAWQPVWAARELAQLASSGAIRALIASTVAKAISIRSRVRGQRQALEELPPFAGPQRFRRAVERSFTALGVVGHLARMVVLV